MHEHDAPEQKGYELSDVQIRLVLWAGVGAVIMTLGAYIVSTFFVKFVNAQDPISDYQAPPIALEAGSQQGFPEGVRLQVAPGDALIAVRAEAHRQATSFGVVSQEPEIYQIPVATAMDIVAERGLPVFQPATTEGTTSEQ